MLSKTGISSVTGKSPEFKPESELAVEDVEAESGEAGGEALTR